MKSNIKHIKKYLKFNESRIIKKLYHGSPKIFKNFYDSTIYFSDARRFSEDYADQKSMDQGLDDTPNIYEVEVTTDLFNINDEEDFKKLKKSLPKEVEYRYNNFGFSEKVDRDDILFWMKGYYMSVIDEEAKNSKIGDTIEYKVSMSQTEKYIIVKKDDEYAYGVSLQDVGRNMSISDSFSKPKYYKYFEPVYKFVEEYSKKEENKKYVTSNIVHMYYIQFNTNDKNNIYDLSEIPKELIKEYNRLYKKAEKDIIENIFKSGYSKKFPIKSTKKKLRDTWRYYENDSYIK